MISAETVPHMSTGAYDLGVQDYISRPFDERTVRRRVINTIMLLPNRRSFSHMVGRPDDGEGKRQSADDRDFVKYRGIQKRGERASCIAYPYADRVVLKALLEKTDKYDIHGKIFR